MREGLAIRLIPELIGTAIDVSKMGTNIPLAIVSTALDTITMASNLFNAILFNVENHKYEETIDNLLHNCDSDLLTEMEYFKEEKIEEFRLQIKSIIYNTQKRVECESITRLVINNYKVYLLKITKIETDFSKNEIWTNKNFVNEKIKMDELFRRVHREYNQIINNIV